MGKLSHLKKAIEGAKRRVYQGSPHKYDGKLDPSKIGTGEGAQAYGYGHYLAEERSVGEGYRDALSRGDGRKAAGRQLGLPETYETNLFLDMAENNNNDISKALADLDRYSQTFRSEGDISTANRLDALHKAIRDKYPAGGVLDFSDNFGHLYEFDLPESAIDNMLDWDAPLSEQSESVRLALREYAGTVYPDGRVDGWAFGGDPVGAEIYETLARKSAEYEPNRANIPGANLASAELSSLGIPGIKYHDGMSRAAGEGTRNFVIFPGRGS